MKLTLSRKLILVFSAVLVTVIALNCGINAFLLEKVYRNMKISAMRDDYGTLKAMCEEGAAVEEITDAVRQIISGGSLRIFVWDSERNLVIDSFPLLHKAEGNDMRFPKQNGENQEKRIQNKRDGRNDQVWHAESFFATGVPPEDEIYSCEDYSIFMMGSFEDLGQQSLYLRGLLPGDLQIVMQMPLAAISEAVEISNTLMLAVGIFMLIIGIVIVSVTSRTIARPVKELSEIADSMQNLDFSRKYEGKSRDEIGSLGESINSLSDKLEDTINELCRKNEQLQKDIELKSKIDKMRAEFTANASHELKTPVALIEGYAEGLRDNIASDEASRRMYTDVIIDETEKMDHIIHQMLDLMELDGIEEAPKKESFSLALLAEDAVNSCDLMIKKNGIDLSFTQKGSCETEGDYWRIYQAVINYITNAINHAEGQKIVRITTEEVANKVRFSVYNSGKNIPEEETGNIWERFYKVDKAHTREYGGSGLGLSIVRSVIELHGGEYGVINKPDGVEFYFILNGRD